MGGYPQRLTENPLSKGSDSSLPTITQTKTLPTTFTNIMPQGFKIESDRKTHYHNIITEHKINSSIQQTLLIRETNNL